MNYNLKIKKLSVILSSIAVALSTISLSSFASAPTGESDNTSSTASPTSESTAINSPQSKVIKIDQPGTYRLVGVGVGNLNSDDPNTILVNTTDRILVEGSGEYNITLDNVNITINEDVTEFPFCPITIASSTQEDRKVNLFIEGKNILKNKLPVGNGIYSTNSLKIAGTNKNAFLNIIADGDCIASWHNIEILSGNIVTTSETRGIIAKEGDLIIKGGNITSTSNHDAFCFPNGKIIISGGTIREKTVWDSQLEDIIKSINNKKDAKRDIKNTNGKIIAHSGENYYITGGTINGVSFPIPITGSKEDVFFDIPFDKELSNDGNIISKKATGNTSSIKKPNTGRSSEVNTFLICTFLGLIFTTLTTLKKSKISN